MKVNFNKTFKDYRGNDLIIEGRPRMMGDVIAQLLFNGEFIKPSGDIMKDSARKLRAYTLCVRIVQALGEMTIEAEDAVLIKEAILPLTPGCYAQIVKLIDE